MKYLSRKWVWSANSRSFPEKILGYDFCCAMLPLKKHVLESGNRSMDIQKYSAMYQEITLLQPEDTLQLIMETNDEKAKRFWNVIGNFLLQEKQRSVIERDLF